MGSSKGIILRQTVHNILYNIFKFNKSLNDPSIKLVFSKFSAKDVAFINHVSLNTMRYQFHCEKIIHFYLKKKPKINEKILFYSAITQLVFLDFKPYAVINCSVEIAKKLKIYHGLVNACLKNIYIDINKLKKVSIEFDNLPNWFKEKTKEFKKIDKKKFLNNFFLEPSIHLVFKSNNYLKRFEDEISYSGTSSGFLKNKIKLTELPSYKKGEWWVQDFSSFYPLDNIPNKLLEKKSIDLCSAPGGKAFQILSRNKYISLNDYNRNRIGLLKNNLKRLKFNPKITNNDILKKNFNQKYDFIILDAPCSAIGTIRRNPEIFFKSKGPDFRKLLLTQREMLEKASLLLNDNGIILYMVCSFLEIETFDQVNYFLNKKKNFYLEKFYLKNNPDFTDVVKQKCMHTLPTKYKNYNVDGFFAAYLKKTK